MTDNEIIKALDCCANCESCDFETTNCPLVEEMECRSLLAQKALDLITRQQAEIERLKTELDFAKAFRKETDAEFSLMHRKYGNMLKAAKSEAYKEFAEELKHFIIPQKADGYTREIVLKRDIDNLLKEMAGEE